MRPPGARKMELGLKTLRTAYCDWFRALPWAARLPLRQQVMANNMRERTIVPQRPTNRITRKDIPKTQTWNKDKGVQYTAQWIMAIIQYVAAMAMQHQGG